MSQSIAASGTTATGLYAPLEPDNSKRVSEPCIPCGKAQLTCDGLRPCQSCSKRGLNFICVDTAGRKKTKYNASSSSSSLAHAEQTLAPMFDPTTSHPATTGALSSQTDPNAMMDQFLDTSQLLNMSLTDMSFGSETASLEYDFLCNMLQLPQNFWSNPDIPSATSTSSPATAPPITTLPATASKPFKIAPSMQSPTAADNGHLNNIATSNNSNIGISTSTSNGSHSGMAGGLATPAPLQPLAPMPPSRLTSAPASTLIKRDSVSSAGSQKSSRKRPPQRTPDMVYNSVRYPFNYAIGFHDLIRYVREKMSQTDLMRISRSLAVFRPSFLALIMNLTEDDLVFMEKCIQRTLLEYEKLIGFSGTPTVVWRRTGEICLVGKEFSLLTQWQRDVLLNKKTYIYELMDNQSAVEYWEKFAKHAFDNTDKACSYSCILRTPNLKPVPCTFCFTIKRDIFDLPSIIVGNFLPILS
ncbi:hypothetical protein BCR43DRAFT_471239 [Syncephalastrum racemosum]|uniref:Zn(2)-C6 fungal-type domain-containing protein n=1 Tax=Syncephalastrum racemosum TaxID=13706 RepID=A0A1X2HI92_SYNRA|nr:hypothetical protein BCR43DRAFT_471239 [Syncephalastrum racemosum]